MKSILRFTESEDYSDRLPRLKEYLSLLDEERGTSFEKVFLELKEILKEKSLSVKCKIDFGREIFMVGKDNSSINSLVYFLIFDTLRFKMTFKKNLKILISLN